MSHEEVEEKARELMTPVLGAERTGQVIDMIWQIDAVEDASVIAPAISRSQAQTK